jgi:transcription initiation factor TFIIE subunit alpha
MLNTKEIFKIVEDMIIEFDEQTIEVLGMLAKIDILSENEIAEELDVKINGARKSLYKLHNAGFVEYTKERDEEKKWWYIYFWHVNRKRLLNVYRKFKENLIKKNKDQIQAESEYSFESKSGEKFKYEEALNHGFISPTDGKPLSEINNFELMQSLEEEVHVLNQEIEKIDDLRKQLAEIEAEKKAEEALIEAAEKAAEAAAAEPPASKKKAVAKVKSKK